MYHILIKCVNENVRYIFFSVTMNWWKDLWLNEGFATFMASKCSDAILPHQGYVSF